jgi:hypothetical protein
MIVNLIKYSKVLLICFLFLVISPKLVKSQELGGAFVMSSVGSIQNLSNNSMPVTFSSNIACLNIQNGTSILISENGNGSFEMNCKISAKFNSLGIQLFPNPVSSISKIKLLNTPPMNENFVITVWGADGFKLIVEKTSGFEMIVGKTIDFSKLTPGAYVVQVESSNFLDALKFIKAK